ncbi:hypothetical protein P167DRAFT_575109 [Morchella conica CCBAS932]|uniref:Uncharacterized protein n=1 Tax=Morchella conica CCBAS932 TaxID=1392247 RepID=A0A3N4KQM6_9PEZI|nr:hypothetical protein P167DRAFT_575109 [Morchella conica CCBAS932]
MELPTTMKQCQLFTYILLYQLLVILHVSAVPRPQAGQLETILTLVSAASSTDNGSAIENTTRDPALTTLRTSSSISGLQIDISSSSSVVTINATLLISTIVNNETSRSALTSTSVTSSTRFYTIDTSTPPPPSPPPPPPPTQSPPPTTEYTATTTPTPTATATATTTDSSTAPTSTSTEEPLRYQGIFGLSLWAKIVIPLSLASAVGFGVFLCVAHRKNMRHKKALAIASGESTPVMREVHVGTLGRRLTL